MGVGEVFDPGHAEQSLDLRQGGLEESDGVSGGYGDGDSAGEGGLGPVVHDTAQVPGPGAVGRVGAASPRPMGRGR